MKKEVGRLMSLFAGLERAHGIYKIEDTSSTTGKQKGRALTLQEPVTEELWARHVAGEIQLGIVPIREDATCLFGAIDVDDYKTDHAALEQKIKKQKLPLVICRSKSGGAHLYGFFAQPTNAEDVRELLSDWAAALGYGNVEIFPKQSRLLSNNDTGNWINMPYCGGDESARYGIRDGERLKLTEFLDYAAKRKITTKHFVRTEDAKPELLEDGPPCLIALSTGGFPEGTRNSGLFALGVYAKRRWPTGWEEKVSEMNDKFMSPPLDSAELTQIIAHLQRKEYTYPCKNPPIVSVCQRATCIKRKYGIGVKDAQEIFGLAFENVQRVETDPPKYHADFNGKRVTFGANEINSQNAMRQSLINQANIVFMPVPTPKWYQFMSVTCAEAEIVAAPPETARKQHLQVLIEDYCLEQVTGRTWEDLIDGQPFEANGRVYFRPHKFVSSINKEHSMKLTMSDVWAVLTEMGAESVEKEIAGKKIKPIWSLPSFTRPKKASGDVM